MVESVVCVVQARAGSTRLPGKVLRDLGGRPMLDFLLARLAPLRAYAPVVVATSTEARDDAVANVAAAAGTPVVRGSESDVLSRYVSALDAHPAEHVIRITADCPLTDPHLVAAVVHRHLATGADYTSNVLPRTFPKGLDVEVIRASVLRTADAEATAVDEREHVTPFVYRRPERFLLANLAHAEPLGAQRWTVDTADDIDALRSMIRLVGAERAIGLGWEDVLEIVGRQTVTEPGALVLRPATSSDSGDLLAWRNDPDAIRFSGSADAVDAVTHEAWLAGKLDRPSSRIYVAEVDGCSVGMLRFDVAAGEGTVSIAVAAEARGNGYASTILARAQDEVRADCQIARLWALVHPDNAASLAAFDRAGFVDAGTQPTAAGVAFRTLRWDR